MNTDFNEFITTPVGLMDPTEVEIPDLNAAQVNSLFQGVSINLPTEDDAEKTVQNFHTYLREQYIDHEGKHFAGTLNNWADVNRLFTYWSGQYGRRRRENSHETAIQRVETATAQAQARDLERPDRNLITSVSKAVGACDRLFGTSFVEMVSTTDIREKDKSSFWFAIQTSLVGEVTMRQAMDPTKVLPEELTSLLGPTGTDTAAVEAAIESIEISDLVAE